MAQLKDTTVSGSLRATDTIYSTTIQAQILKAPTVSNGATYGPGTNGHLLKSNGSSMYWGTIAASDVGLGNVENTALSTWTGSTNIKTVGTITSGTWNGTAIASAYIGSHTHSYAGSSSAGGAATNATTTADTTNALYLVGVTSAATTTLKRNTSISMTGGTITATTFSGDLSGNATTATTATNLDAAPTLVQTGTSTIDLSPNTTYTLTVGGQSVIFKTPNDTKVTQSNKAYSGYSYWRPLVIGSRNASTANGLSNTAADTTDLVYTFSNIIAQPSTGTIKATIFDGKASTAVKWHSAQTVYVNLANASTSTTLQGGSSNAEVLGVNGTLAVANGGTGMTTAGNKNAVVIGNGTTATDAFQTVRTASGAFYATGQDEAPSFGTLPVVQGGTGVTSVTKYGIAYGNSDANGYAFTSAGSDGYILIGKGNAAPDWQEILPITHGGTGTKTAPTQYGVIYASSTTSYASTDAGAANHVLVGVASGAPKWTTVATLDSNTSTTANTAAYDTLTLGNTAKVSSTTAHSEGRIYLYSADSKAHIIKGTATDTEYTHTLPSDTGVLVSLSGGTAKGSTTKPIYVPNTGIVTECDTYAGGTAVTLNGSSKAASTASFYAPTSSGTVNDILASGGANATPTWITPASGALYATSSGGAASFGTLPVAQGGTGLTTATNVNSVLIGNSTTANSNFQTIRTASGAFYATAQDGKPAFGTLPVAQGGTNATSVTKYGIAYGNSGANGYTFTAAGTDGYILIGKGGSAAPEWQQTLPTSHGGTGVTSHTANRLVWSTSATAIQATDAHYASATQISIASNSAPSSGYAFKVNGKSEYTDEVSINGELSIQSLDVQTQSIYFKHHTNSVNSKVGRIYHWAGSATNITHSQLNFQEYSFSSTASATPLSYYEQYSLPDCNAGLTANVSYDIITTKNLTDITEVGTITSGTWNGSKIDVSYLSSSTPNRLVWSQSTGTLVAGYHYVSGTQMSIGTTGAPDTGYTLKVNGALEAAGVINIITNTLTKDLYFSNGTPGSCGVVGRIMYNIGTGPNITKSYMCFVENSYSSTASATPIVYGEYYYLPACTAGLTQNLSYNILTTKSTVTVAQGGTGATTALKAFEALSCRGVPSSITTLDDIKGAGYYWVNTSNIANGWPSDISGTQYALLEVVASNAYAAGVSNGIAIQRLNMYSSTASYSRLWANGQWYSWETSFSSTSLPNPLRSRQVPSNTANFDSLTTAGVYDVINNITNGYPGTSGSNPKYGTLVVFTTHRGPSGSSGNVTLQLFYGNSPNLDQNQHLYVRVKYGSAWKHWHEVTLTRLTT